MSIFCLIICPCIACIDRAHSVCWLFIVYCFHLKSMQYVVSEESKKIISCTPVHIITLVYCLLSFVFFFSCSAGDEPRPCTCYTSTLPLSSTPDAPCGLFMCIVSIAIITVCRKLCVLLSLLNNVWLIG
jgi:hypothetical protein